MITPETIDAAACFADDMRQQYPTSAAEVDAVCGAARASLRLQQQRDQALRLLAGGTLTEEQVKESGLGFAWKRAAAHRQEVNRLRQWLRFAGLNPDDLDGQGFPKAMPTEAQASAMQRESAAVGRVKCNDCRAWESNKSKGGYVGFCPHFQKYTDRYAPRSCTMFEAKEQS